MLSPVLEKEGILGNTTGRRPGDVTIQRWAEDKGLAVDVAVTSPLAATYLSRSLVSGMLPHRSMASTTRALKALIASSVRWCLKH